VVADAVNSHPQARATWVDLAADADARLVVLEVVCSDHELHRRRLEARREDVPPVHWTRVQSLREGYVPWPVPTTVVDTAGEVDVPGLVALVRES